MKTLILSLLILVSAPALAAPVLICQSPNKIEGWTGVGTNDHLRFTAYVKSETELQKAEVSGAYGSDVRDLSVDLKYVPKAPAYRDYNRFGVLEDAWHWFMPLLPKDFSTRKGGFPGYMQILGEGGNKGTVRLRCFVRPA